MSKGSDSTLVEPSSEEDERTNDGLTSILVTMARPKRRLVFLILPVSKGEGRDVSLFAEGEKGRSMMERWLSELTLTGGFEGRTGVLASRKNVKKQPRFNVSEMCR